MQWEHIQNVNIKGYAKISMNQEENLLYLVGKNRLITYNIQSDTQDTIRLSADPYLFGSYYQGVFDGKWILSYYPNAEQLIKIDPVKGDVNHIIKTSTPRKFFLQHNKYLDQEKQILYVFNGYGYHTYSNSMYRCNTNNNTWELIKTSGEVYPPRYLAASGYLDDTLYVLGGYGNLFGDQMLGAQYFYDLNSVSLKDFNYEKKWDYEQPFTVFCFAN